MAETKEERRLRIQKEVAERSAQREKEYFERQAASKTKAATQITETPTPDAFVYSNVWRQGVGDAGGRFSLVKTPNPYYDPVSNTVTDPVTGETRPAGVSMTSSSIAFPGGLPSVAGKSVTSFTRNANGTYTVRYSDGTSAVTDADGKPVVSTVVGPTLVSGPTLVTGPTLVSGGPTLVNGGPTLISGPTLINSGPTLTNTGLTTNQATSLRAFDIFRGFLRQYGIEALAADVEKYKLDGLSDEELLMRLRTESTAYKRRFQANEARVQKGLRALTEAEYIGLEDQYQDVMRRYGLPISYYTRGDMGRQEGFEKFIAGDVSPVELEDRIQTAQNRVLNAPPQVREALTQFYGGEISNGDVLAYMLDPDRALPQIQRKVTAAEIGAGAALAGLGTTRTRAEELATFGVTGEAARQGFQGIAEFLPSAQKLSQIYQRQGVGPYTQTTAEQEVFGLGGAAEAQRQRRKLTELEQAAFAGQAGAASGALARDRAGAF